MQTLAEEEAIQIPPLRLCDSACLVMAITLTGKKKTQGLGDTRQSAALALAAPSADLSVGSRCKG